MDYTFSSEGISDKKGGLFSKKKNVLIKWEDATLKVDNSTFLHLSSKTDKKGKKVELIDGEYKFAVMLFFMEYMVDH